MNSRFQTEKIYGPTLIFLGILILMSFQNCAKPGIESSVGKSSELSSTVSGPLSVTQSDTDQSTSMKFSCTPGKTLTIYQSSRASSNKTCQELSANVVCPQGGSFRIEGYSSLTCGIACSGSSSVVRYKDKNKSCSDSQNKIEKTCQNGYADISSDFDQTGCVPDSQSKSCSVFIDGVASASKILSGTIVKKYLYTKSLNCNDAQLSPSEEKTCGADGASLNFSKGYNKDSCTTLDSKDLVHYVRLIYGNTLLKILRYTYNPTSKTWTATNVWDKNKKASVPTQQKVLETVPERLIVPFLLQSGVDVENAKRDLFALVSNVEPLGQYVESVIDLGNLEYGKNTQQFSAYDYALMYPDVNNYMATTYVKNFTANPWTQAPCLDLYTDKNTQLGIDWSSVETSSVKSALAYECSYKAIYAIFGDKDPQGNPIQPETSEWNAKVQFKNAFISGSGPEYKFFYDHYNNDGGKREFRNPNLFFDDVAYYYQYLYSSSVYNKKEIFDSSGQANTELSGVGFRHYKTFGIVTLPSSAVEVVAFPVIPRFDEVMYLQQNSDVLKSVYMHTLNPSDKNSLESGSFHYIKWGREELRRGYYLKQSMY